MPRMKTSFKGLVKLLAKSLYPETDVFIRELIQNAHDSIQFRRVDEPDLPGKIEVFTDSAKRTITFVDNGLGMDRYEIEAFLSTIGSTGAGTMKEELARKEISIETIGQFGIGLLSAFVVAERIDVYTRKAGARHGWRWVNRGDEEYTLTKTDEAPEPGARVVVTAAPDYARHVDEKRVRDAVKRYADFLPFQIFLNGNGPVNAVDAPWHRTTWAGEEDYIQALENFLSERYPDFPLHVIPVDMASPRAKGVLYVTNQRIPLVGTTGVVDIFQERMCIRLGDQELLPDWARFIKGVVDSPDLRPTAARDNVMKDGAYFQLRIALGDLIVKSIMEIAGASPAKFNQICDWHHFHIKGMAIRNEAFFTTIIDYLLFPTSQGALTFKQYLEKQTVEPGRKTPVYFFSYDQDANQFHELCRSKGLIAINTARDHDEKLVRKYVERRGEDLELKQLDDLDDPRLYQPLDEEEHRLFYPLENAMRQALERAGVRLVRPTTRRFAPDTMSGVILETRKIEAYKKMEVLLREPFMIQGLGELAEEVTEQMRRKPMDLFINADNPLIQALRLETDIDHPRHDLILVGVFNNAILYSRRRMTPENVGVFHHQHQALMREHLALKKELRDALARQAAARPAPPDRGWTRLLVIMPPDDPGGRLESALRDILERPPWCFELKTAVDRGVSPGDEITRRIHDADGYIADITTRSIEVMMILGRILYDPELARRPLLLTRGESSERLDDDIFQRPPFTHLSLDDSEAPGDAPGDLAERIQGREPFQILRERARKRFLSARMLRDFPYLPDDDGRQAILSAFQTVEDLLSADDDAFKEKLAHGGNEALAFLRDPLQKHVRKLLGV
ncbi:MAG: hypothetical protein GY859_34165 [Desulfobacterales bacterium]|nr:hypothetical protein [Desulfobacterales bacterium]